MPVQAWGFLSWSLSVCNCLALTCPSLPTRSSLHPDSPCVLMARSLGGNRIGDAGACGLVAGLAGNTTLETLG